MLGVDDLIKLEALRTKVFAHIKKRIEDGDSGKSYEGTFELGYPSYHEPEIWGLQLHCYLIGPARHYSWEGYNLAECITKAEKDVDLWIKQEDE